MKHPAIGNVKTNTWLTPNVFELVISFPDNSPAILPGQFVEIKCQGNQPLYLNRPFSPFKINGADWHFLIQKKGKGTENLSHLKTGDQITLLAPLGKPFLPPAVSNKVLLVAGGVGVTPIYFYLTHYFPKFPSLQVTLLYGTTEEKEKITFPALSEQVHVYYHADYASSQENGNLYQYYQQLPSITSDLAFICGPLPMMRAFSKQFIKENRLHYVSLEIMMACGLGFCKGCSISTSEGMKSVCSDGPVFDGKVLDWNLL